MPWSKSRLSRGGRADADGGGLGVDHARIDLSVLPSDVMNQPVEGVLPVVLAAGLGTRMKSSKPKVLHELCGRPMLAYVLDAAREVAAGRPLVVYSPATAAITEIFAADADFALQEVPLGTADALRAAVAAAPSTASEILVLQADVPLVQPDLLAEMIDLRRARNAAMALVAVHTADPEGLGRVLRTDDGGQVLRIVEEKDATPDEREIEEINAGVYAFDAAWLRRRIGDVKPSPVSGEFYLPALVELAHEDKRPVVSLEVEDDGTLTGVNDRSQLAAAELEMRMIINERHMLAGVTFVDPARTYVDATVELAQDVVLEPGVILRGRTRIGEGTRVGAGSQIIDTTIGARCFIWASVLESSEVEDEVQIGPMSHLRAGSSIGRRARLGNFAEVKASRLDNGVQQHHFSYIGDAELGERTNVGAGTITCNYDGVRKHKTKIGKHVFLGSDTMLVAPLELGDEARTGAGSVVTRDVPAGMLALGVPARLRKPRQPDGEPPPDKTE
jgi:bifunctional UDP-N-acetylglucosamine pyrophosphorylase/glucosamine-1-phosphate N-acetyltransferase